MDFFRNVDIMNKALDATVLKYSVISDNISNEDTPGYKRKDVAFENILESEIQKQGVQNLDLSSFEPKVYIDRQNYTYRMDGNNVDIDTEMSEAAQVKLKYDTLIERVSSQLSRFRTILQTVK